MAAVLYYDPDPACRDGIGRALAVAAGVEVLTAGTIEEAYTLARGGSVEVVAADPPGNEVVPFVSTVREVLGPVPVILFLPPARALDALRGMNGGAHRFVEKRGPPADAVSDLANAVLAALAPGRGKHRPEARPEHLEFLSRTALDFIGLEDDEEIYRYIAGTLAEIIPGSAVAVCSLDPGTGILTTRAFAGEPADLAVLEEELGRPFVGIELVLGGMPAAQIAFACRALVEGPSTIRTLFFDQIPEEVGARIDERLSWGRSWVMGFSCREGVLGNIIVRLRRGSELENRELAEAFIGQASVALLRHVARQRLLESEARYRAVVESQQELVSRFRPGGIHHFANEAYCRFFGLDRETLRGSRFLPEMPGEDRVALCDFFSGFSPERPDGIIEHRVYLPDGTTRWVQWSSRAFFDRDGKLGEFQSVGRDVTGQKEAEIALAALTAELEARVEAATTELRSANREIEAFSYHVSHDLRGPLRAIDGYLGMLVSRFGSDLDPEAAGLVERAREVAVRAGRFLECLLALSSLSHQPLSVERVETASLVEDVLGDLLPDPGERRVEVVVGPLPPCRADPVLIRHVYENLVANSLKFTRDRDPARIEIGALAVDGQTVYTVRDNGVGFDSWEAPRVFDTFFRLHDTREYEGAGIGLSLVRRIVERHGGRVWADSVPGEGATFSFTIPAA